ncbi:MAG: hypothetical protein J3Q66DRAFT_351817, partial [Benniella sp.]
HVLKTPFPFFFFFFFFFTLSGPEHFSFLHSHTPTPSSLAYVPSLLLRPPHLDTLHLMQHKSPLRPSPYTTTCPLDLPEILLYIAPFLALKDLVACVRVCCQWQKLFTPFIWYYVNVPDDWNRKPSFPPLDALQKNAHNVRELTLNASEGLSPFLRHCTHLKILVVFGHHIANPHPDLWVELTDLVRRNPTLEWLILGFASGLAAPASFLRALPEACPNLKRFESSQGRYESTDQIEALLYAMSQLKMAASRYERFSNNPCLQLWTFPHLVELTLKDAEGFSPQTQVDMICQCPNLQHLKWTIGSRARFPIKEFCKRVPIACPKLCGLHMDGCGLPDPEDIGRFLCSLSRLEILSLVGCSITKRSFVSLGRHFETLVTLDIADCFDVRSWMVQGILESCHNLTTFKASTLTMEDITDGKDWTAVQLRHLEVVITQKGAPFMGAHWITFGRLSKLTRLQNLSIGPQRWIRRTGLKFLMEFGLEQLKTLTRLRVLNLGKTEQHMSEQEVTWIGNHLENLTRVEGSLNIDWDQQRAMAGMLRGFGLEVIEGERYEAYDQRLVCDLNDDEDDDEDDRYDDYEEYDVEYIDGEDDEGYEDGYGQEQEPLYQSENIVEMQDGAQNELVQLATEQGQ